MERLNLNEVTEMGRQLMSPRELAQNLQVPFQQVKELLLDENNEFYTAYIIGVLQTKTAHATDVISCNNTPDDNRMIAERIQRFDEQFEIQLC